MHSCAYAKNAVNAPLGFKIYESDVDLNEVEDAYRIFWEAEMRLGLRADLIICSTSRRTLVCLLVCLVVGCVLVLMLWLDLSPSHETKESDKDVSFFFC